MIGRVVEGYELAEKLGDGGTGETYLGVHRESGQRAAVKVLFAELAKDPSVVARFLADVTTASKVNHVGIADLYACGVHESGRAFVITELLEGKTLTDALIEVGQVSDMESLADIGWQLATLLDAVHAAGIIHGALKPDGIFMTFPPEQDGRALVKLLDFGTAKLALDVRHSQTGSLLGAPLYMSPEASRGVGDLDGRADIYSLGCILFEMACGRPPFIREGKGELIIAHATESPPSVASLEPTVPAAIDTLVGRMLTKNPAARPQTMADVALVLERFIRRRRGEAGAAAPAAVAISPPGPSPKDVPAAASASVPILGPGPFVPPVEPLPLPPAVGAPRPVPRRQDPTALLPPARLLPAVVDGGPLERTWIEQVQKRTAVVEPSVRGPRPARGPRVRERPSAGVRTPLRDGVAPSRSFLSSISVPVVILTASVIITIGTAVLLLRDRRSAPPRPTRPPLLEPRTQPSAGDEPLRAALAVPTPASSPPRPAAPAGRAVGATAAPPEAEPPSDPGVVGPGRSRSEKQPPAKRW